MASSEELSRPYPNRLVKELDLSTRAATALVWDGLEQVHQVAVKTDAELLRIPNLGRTTLKEIRALIPHDPELMVFDAAAEAERCRNAAHKQEIQQALKQQEFKQYKRTLHLETVIAKCAAQFRRYAAEARHNIGVRGSNENDMVKLDEALTHDMMAGMCEEALKE